MTQDLFDTLSVYSGPLKTKARARNDIGYLAEQIASRVIGLEITPITNQKLCPDFRLGDLRGEIKSVGTSGQALIWKWRLEKEQAAFDPKQYLYIFVRHAVKVTSLTRQEMIQQTGKHPPTLIAATLHDVMQVIGDRPPKKFSIHSDPTHGSQRKGYIDGGWQFRLNKIVIQDSEIKVVKWPWLFGEIMCKINYTSAYRHTVCQ